jgi:phosphate transport system permease protein
MEAGSLTTLGGGRTVLERPSRSGAAGETAPLLLTVAFVFGAQFDLGQRMNSLPLQIFNDVGQAQDRLVQRAWGAALTLVVLVLVLTLLARLVQRRSRLA